MCLIHHLHLRHRLDHHSDQTDKQTKKQTPPTLVVHRCPRAWLSHCLCWSSACWTQQSESRKAKYCKKKLDILDHNDCRKLFHKPIHPQGHWYLRQIYQPPPTYPTIKNYKDSIKVSWQILKVITMSSLNCPEAITLTNVVFPACWK